MKVAESNRLKHRLPAYLYLGNVLIHVFDSRVEGDTNIYDVSRVTNPLKSRLLRTGELLYGVFLVSGTPIAGTVDGLLPIYDGQTMVADARGHPKGVQEQSH
ncbi:hypothetical protein HK100_009909, partial [Physocladia obscura]